MNEAHEITTLWKMPVPSSGINPHYKALPGRTYVVHFDFDDDTSTSGYSRCELTFEKVEAFQCTYLPCATVEMIDSAYDRLVSMGNSPWLKSLPPTHPEASPVPQRRHLRIYFDDGPCLDFLCTTFTVRNTAIETPNL